MTTADAPLAAPEPAGGPPGLFANPDFARYQIARFLLTIGIQMQSVAVGYYVYDVTHSALAL
ncbi:MAG TPA: MFS transporter, partial [Polyangiaceae bacterium]